MRGDGKKEATRLACEAARRRGGEATNTHEGGDTGERRGGDECAFIAGTGGGEMDTRLPCGVRRWAHVSSGSGNALSIRRLIITDDVA
jgi:hypothetical protein